MRKMILTVVALGTLTAGVFAADATPDSDSAKPHRRPAGNADGSRPAPTPEQIAKRKELIAKFDKNGDGKLDETERAAAREARKANHGKPHTAPAPAPAPAPKSDK